MSIERVKDFLYKHYKCTFQECLHMNDIEYSRSEHFAIKLAYPGNSEGQWEFDAPGRIYIESCESFNKFSQVPFALPFPVTDTDFDLFKKVCFFLTTEAGENMGGDFLYSEYVTEYDKVLSTIEDFSAQYKSGVSNE